jgi:hypothetical protein
MSIETFHYRLGGRAAGRRPGAHAARAAGAGNEFLAHARLFDHPDPRRLDLRASLRTVSDDWLVRTHRQRAAVSVHAVVDVSASMDTGLPGKREVAAAFVEAMGSSAFQAGDAAGLCAFDGRARTDLYRPARHARMVGHTMAALLRAAPAAATPGCGLAEALMPLAGKRALVFLVSDFHWPLAHTAAALELLASAWVVPIVLWDASETSPPPLNAFVRLRDAESGRLRALWVTARLRLQWQLQIAQRRAALEAVFAARDLRGFHVSGSFDAAALTRYFLDGGGA